MQALLNDLLELSRIGRLVNKPQSIDFKEMLSEVVELLHGRLHGGTVPIRVSVHEQFPTIYGDRQRLFEAVQNLVDNAAKFMGNQPHPHIEIGQEGTLEDGTPSCSFEIMGSGSIQGSSPSSGYLISWIRAPIGRGWACARKRIIEFHGGRIWVDQAGKGRFISRFLKETCDDISLSALSECP
jgi:signal transduction histidine kinase